MCRSSPVPRGSSKIYVTVAQLISRRGEIEASLIRISNAILILSGQEIPVPIVATTVSGRKQMSAEARQRISEGLRASHLAKRSDVAAGVPSAPAEEPVPVEQPTVAEPASRGRKATKA
jgi:hypothetical protein